MGIKTEIEKQIRCFKSYDMCVLHGFQDKIWESKMYIIA